MDAFKANANSAGLVSQRVNDAIITKNGKVIQTAPDDNIYAFKSLGGAAPPWVAPRQAAPARYAESEAAVHNTRSARPTPAPVAIQFGDVIITAAEGSTPEDARRIGVAAAEGFSSRLAQELSMSLLREGA